MKPGDRIEWCYANPSDGVVRIYDRPSFFVMFVDNDQRRWREIPTQGHHMLVSVEAGRISWFSNGKFYAENLDVIAGGLEFLTGSVRVFPRPVQIDPSGW